MRTTSSICSFKTISTVPSENIRSRFFQPSLLQNERQHGKKPERQRTKLPRVDLTHEENSKIGNPENRRFAVRLSENQPKTQIKHKLVRRHSDQPRTSADLRNHHMIPSQRPFFSNDFIFQRPIEQPRTDERIAFEAFDCLQKHDSPRVLFEMIRVEQSTERHFQNNFSEQNEKNRRENAKVDESSRTENRVPVAKFPRAAQENFRAANNRSLLANQNSPLFVSFCSLAKKNTRFQGKDG